MQASDAERWQALVSCGRIRVLGTAALGTKHAHIGLELWAEYPNIEKEVQQKNIETLIAFVDGLIAINEK